MLRPEQMSKVSVTGARREMATVVETLHELNLVHLSDYDGSWEGFEVGDPVEGAEEASDKLVTIRSIESILDIDEENAGPERIVTDEALESELADAQSEVNSLEDQRSNLEAELRRIEEELDELEPYRDLGIDLDLLSGYESVQVAVGEADVDAVERALEADDGIQSFGTYTGDGVVAVFARPVDDADVGALDDALVGVDFADVEIPDAEGSPEQYAEKLEHERQKLESRLTSTENELEELKLEFGSFLLAAEEKLTVDVQKAEAPLQFATTEHSFVAEGWIPAERYTDLVQALEDAVGDAIAIDELERATYEEKAHVGQNENTPPVVQNNPETVKPFELLIEVVNRPRYFELDPTVILFLSFPLFFGLMIGDVGYGLLYLGLGWLLYNRLESPAFKALGGITIWAGIFTVVFGVLYGELFGLHAITGVFWEPVFGLHHPPLEKGLDSDFALLWLVASLLFGLLHLSVGYLFGFINDIQNHSVVQAAADNLSWFVLMNGLWVWVLSRHVETPKPDFLFTVFNGEPLALGFGGFSEPVGLAALGVAALGLLGVIYGEYMHEGGVGVIIGTLESVNVIVNVISYTRIAAVLLAKAGMAFVVNLLAFGAYRHDGLHFMLGTSPDAVAAQYGAEAIMFPGLIHSGIGGAIASVLVLVFGHLLVLGLGVTSAGLQGVRLEYVEFFGKFYDGGGEKYKPFGYKRRYTTED